MPDVLAYAAPSATAPFELTTITRREPGPTEVFFEVTHAGICHSDIHTVRQEWGPVTYPIVPGHELAGIVRQVGSEVTSVAVGDHVGVGCFVDSCGECEMCAGGKQQFCSGRPGTIWTYNSTGRDGLPTAGGYSQGITVEQDYLIRIPESIELQHAAPLMCAGITLYSPLKRWGAGPGVKVGIVGLGGLGHVGVKLAVAMGAEVTVLSRSLAKREDGLAFGAVDYRATEDPQTFKDLRGHFDLIVNTVSAHHDMTGLINLLRTEGVLVDVGLPEEPVTLQMGALVGQQRILAGSNIGGIELTQEMIEFCAEHGVAPTIEVITGDQITDAYDKVVNSQVRYRYVIDTSSFGQ